MGDSVLREKLKGKIRTQLLTGRSDYGKITIAFLAIATATTDTSKIALGILRNFMIRTFCIFLFDSSIQDNCACLFSLSLDHYSAEHW